MTVSSRYATSVTKICQIAMVFILLLYFEGYNRDLQEGKSSVEKLVSARLVEAENLERRQSPQPRRVSLRLVVKQFIFIVTEAHYVGM